jgi:hypothetical protein
MVRPGRLFRIGLGSIAVAARLGQIAAGSSSTAVVADRLEPEPVAETSESPGAFLRRHLELELSGRFARSWDELHPAHQQVVSRERYAKCRTELFAQADVSARLEAFEVIETVDEPLELPGIPETMSKAVRVRYRIGGTAAPHAAAETLHAVEVGGRWAWILPPSAYRAYEAGSRPGIER